MLISKPYKTAKLSDISQPFGVNPQPYQPQGHTGVDFCAPYGTFLVAPDNCKVERIITDTNFNADLSPLSRGYGILLKSITQPYTYLHWHCLPAFPVKEGDTVLRGQPVAQMGNSGFVMSNGVIVPVERRTQPPYPGTHDHFEMRINSQFVDPIKYMDFSIPIKYDLMTTISEILKKMIGLIK
jgi:murein DD-endopeptidase MepM/ murein hydrolase activator NlpD